MCRGRAATKGFAQGAAYLNWGLYSVDSNITTPNGLVAYSIVILFSYFEIDRNVILLI